MKQATTDLIDLLNTSEEFFMAELYTITLNDNSTVLRYTNADQDLTVNGFIYRHDSVQIQRGRVSQSIGIDVDDLDLTLYADDNDRVLDMPVIHAFRAGTFDGAYFTVEILFMKNWENREIPPLVHFSGRIVVDELGRNYAKLKVKSETELLNIKLPCHLVMPGCSHALYGPGCNLNREAVAINGQVQMGSSGTKIMNALNQPEGWFDLGVIEFTGGQNVNIKRTVRHYRAGEITLVYPLPNIPEAGDPYRIYPGCDKTAATCRSKFNNLTHFRGYPFVPKPETVY